MSFWSTLKNVVSAVFGVGGAEEGSTSGSDEQYEKLLMAIADFVAKVEETIPYGMDADERYLAILDAQLTGVPSIDMYDGPYVDALVALQASAQAVNEESELDELAIQLTDVSTQIQTYLNEETSNLEAAKLWHAKFIQAMHDHTQIFRLKGEDRVYDSTMSKVMEAYRRVAETNQFAINLFGSDQLINATYEEVTAGGDALSYINEILELNYVSGVGGGLNETVIVPNADAFSAGFFL